jgi:hypothetical protein
MMAPTGASTGRHHRAAPTGGTTGAAPPGRHHRGGTAGDPVGARLVVVGGAGGVEAPEALVAFSVALDRVARRFFWWVLVAHVGLSGVDVAGQRIGIYPFGWILTPLVLLALLDLRGTVTAPAARRALTTVLVVATVTGALDLTAALATTSADDQGSFGITWILTMVGLGSFGTAMVRWADDPGTVATLGGHHEVHRAWRRSSLWAWAGVAASLGTLLGRTVQVLAGGEPLADAWTTTELEGAWGGVAFVLLLVLGLGPVLSAAASTTRTRRVLPPPAAVRPQRRLAGGG